MARASVEIREASRIRAEAGEAILGDVASRKVSAYINFMNLQALPRVPLAHLPTPVEELRRLSEHLNGPHILMKRDDQTGLAFGGNKVRKLEYLMADAVSQHADVILTAGAAQSNHCRQTAAAAARMGLSCELVLGGEKPTSTEGNLLLDNLFGAKIHWARNDRRGECLDDLAKRMRESGRHPYLIPYGGSNAIGATGYVAAMMELMSQTWDDEQTVDFIVFASSSGGTQAGLMVGAAATGFGGQIIGISVDKGEREAEPYNEILANLANATAARVGLQANFSPEDPIVNYDYLGEGYGVVSDLERDAIRLLATREGILIDPVYTGRAMGGLIDMIEQGEFGPDDTVLFWHTGGAPALFAYHHDLL